MKSEESAVAVFSAEWRFFSLHFTNYMDLIPLPTQVLIKKVKPKCCGIKDYKEQ